MVSLILYFWRERPQLIYISIIKNIWWLRSHLNYLLLWQELHLSLEQPPWDPSLAPRSLTRKRRAMKESILSVRKVCSWLPLGLFFFVSDFLCIDERLKRLQESLKKQGFEQVPSEIQRAQETLTLIFKQFELDPIADKALYDTLIDWKRTLWRRGS